MPKNLTGSPATFPTQTAPLTGEPRTSGSVETPFQNSANRTQFLYDRLLYLDPVKGGVRRLRRFASIAAMRASNDHAVGTICVVDEVGMYEYCASTATNAEPFSVRPDDVAELAAGRWLLSGFGALDVAGGVPRLDGSGKVKAAQLDFMDVESQKVRPERVKNGLVAVLPFFFEGVTGTASESFVNAHNPDFCQFQALKGDIFMVTMSVSGANSESEKSGQQVAVTIPDTSVLDVRGTKTLTYLSDEYQRVASAGSYVATADGLHKFAVQHRTGASPGMSIIENLTLTILQLRP